MKADIINTQHCIRIEDHYIEICYYFKTKEITIMIDDNQFTVWHFNPARLVMNYSNMVELGVQVYEKWKQREKDKSKMQVD